MVLVKQAVVKTGILTKPQALVLGILVAIIVALITFYYLQNSENKSNASGKFMGAPSASYSII